MRNKKGQIEHESRQNIVRPVEKVRLARPRLEAEVCVGTANLFIDGG